MGLSRRKFTREFKLAVIEQLERGVSVAAVARANEVSPNVLHRWRHSPHCRVFATRDRFSRGRKS
jgi:transposase-like protein